MLIIEIIILEATGLWKRLPEWQLLGSREPTSLSNVAQYFCMFF